MISSLFSSCFLWSAVSCEGSSFDDHSLTQKSFLPDGGTVSRRLGPGQLVLGWRGQSRHFWNGKLLLRYLHCWTGRDDTSGICTGNVEVLHFTTWFKGPFIKWYHYVWMQSFVLTHLDKRENDKSSLNSSLVPGGEWSSQAEWCSWRSGAGRAAGVWGALATTLCVSQWGQSQGFHIPQWHQGEFSVTQHHFLCCLSSQKDTDVILQISISVFVFSFTHHVYCCVCLLPQVLTVTSLALPMSEVFTVQWALWCTELYYPGPFGSLWIVHCWW